MKLLSLSVLIMVLIDGIVSTPFFFGDDDEKIKPKIYGLNNNKYVPSFNINLYREHLKELRAESEDHNQYVEGDIKRTSLLDRIRKGNDRSAWNTFRSNMKWRSNTIPYVFDSSLTEHKRGAIESAFRDFHDYTCLRFTRRNNENDYLNFIKHTHGCWSYLGRQGGKQDISLGSGCGYKGTVLHEIMHALGFFHEHTRNDRDKYLKINKGSISSKYEDDLDRYNNTILTDDSTYDYFSIMHYGTRAFSSNYISKTMEPKDDSVDDDDLGQRKGLSERDVYRIRRVYCHGRDDGKSNSPPQTDNTNHQNNTFPAIDCGIRYQSYPCWPADFVWSYDGLPPTCHCNPQPHLYEVCQCDCMKVHSNNSDIAWNNNLLCHTEKERNPHFELSNSGMLPDKQCLKFPESKGWDDSYLCNDMTAPYDLTWSSDIANENNPNCLTINEPFDPSWDKKYLCARN